MKPEIKKFDIRLNVHYDLPAIEWKKIEDVYRTMDGFIQAESVADCQCWYGDENSDRYIIVSVEPSRFAFEALIEEAIWIGWLTILCSRLSLALGREVRDAEM